MSNYEPPCTVEGSSLIPGQEGELFPGVKGYAIEKEGLIYIPLIIADREGSGQVGKFLDSLSPRCRVVSLTSPRLMGMLVRRGWIPTFTKTDEWSRP